MALVSEIRRTRGGQTFVLARFVVTAAGAQPVEVAPRGLALVRDAVERGVPSPTGAGSVRPTAGRAFLEALPEAYRKAALHATAPFECPDDLALSGLDARCPAPAVRLVETAPRARQLCELTPRPRLTIGDGPDDAICLTPIRGCSGTFTVLTWDAGWLWAEPGPSPDAGRLDGFALRSSSPGNRVPVDPGAELIYGNRSFRLDFDVNPSAATRAPQ